MNNYKLLIRTRDGRRLSANTIRWGVQMTSNRQEIFDVVMHIPPETKRAMGREADIIFSIGGPFMKLVPLDYRCEDMPDGGWEVSMKGPAVYLPDEHTSPTLQYEAMKLNQRAANRRPIENAFWDPETLGLDPYSKPNRNGDAFYKEVLGLPPECSMFPPEVSFVTAGADPVAARMTGLPNPVPMPAAPPITAKSLLELAKQMIEAPHPDAAEAARIRTDWLNLFDQLNKPKTAAEWIRDNPTPSPMPPAVRELVQKAKEHLAQNGGFRSMTGRVRTPPAIQQPKKGLPCSVCGHVWSVNGPCAHVAVGVAQVGSEGGAPFCGFDVCIECGGLPSTDNYHTEDCTDCRELWPNHTGDHWFRGCQDCGHVWLAPVV